MFLLGQSERVDKSHCSLAQISELRICIESFYGKLLNSYLFYFFFLQLFQKCCLVQRILDAWEANDKIQ